VNPYASLRGLPRDVWVLCGATLVNRMGAMAAPFLALYCTQHLRVGEGRAGLALGVYGAGMILSAPLGGWLCDRVGARRVFAWSLGGAGVLMLLFPHLRGWPVVLALAFVWALFAEAGRPSSMAVLANAAPPERMRPATAAFRLSMNMGMSIGPPVGGLLAAWSFPALFFVNGSAALAAFGLVAWGLPPRGDRRPNPASIGSMFRAMGRDRRLLAFCLGFALLWGGFVLEFAPLSVHIVQGLGHSPRLYGGLVALNTVLIVLFEVPLLARAQAMRYARMFVIGGVLTAAGLLLLALDTIPAIAAGVAVSAFGEMFFMGAAMPFIAALAPEGRQGAYMGAYSLAAGAAMALAPAFGTAALGRVEAPLVWIGGAVVALIGTAVLVRAAREGGDSGGRSAERAEVSA
jgi:MFS family permease